MEFEDYLKMERNLHKKMEDDSRQARYTRKERRYTRDELRKQKTARILLIILFIGFAILAAAICTTSAASEEMEELFTTATIEAAKEKEPASQETGEEDHCYEDFMGPKGPMVVPSETEPEDFENEKIEAALLERAHKIETCTITYYCAERYPHICGTGDGITASGTEVVPYVSCAVDKNVIPLGSTVMVDYGDGELHYYVADDIGQWVDGNHIDLAVTTHDEAEQLGIKTATVYWCEEGD